MSVSPQFPTFTAGICSAAVVFNSLYVSERELTVQMVALELCLDLFVRVVKDQVIAASKGGIPGIRG
jgi:hypothetical protein